MARSNHLNDFVFHLRITSIVIDVIRENKRVTQSEMDESDSSVVLVV